MRSVWRPGGLHTGMTWRSFSEYVLVREGLLAPDRAPAAGRSKINPTPFTNDQRRKLKVSPVTPPNPIRPVAQVVPQDMIGKVTPPMP